MLTCTVHHVRRLLPPRLPLAFYSQGCLWLRILHRRHLLLPVRHPLLPVYLICKGYVFANKTHSWLTAFIFAAQDYNWLECTFYAPPGLACSRKYANEAFIFLAFIFTFFGMLLEILSLWSQREENPHLEKNGHAAPAPPAATSAV